MKSFMHMPTPLFALSHGKIQDANEAFLKLMGYRWDELNQKQFLSIISPSFRTLVHMESVATHDKPWELEVKAITKNKENIWIHLILQDYRVGKDNWAWGFAYDITKYKEIIDKLEIREAQYSEILDNMDEEVSRENPEGIVTYVNDAYCKYYGIPKNLAIGRQGLDVVIPMDRLKYAVVYELTPENSVYKLDCRVKKANGEIAWIQCTGRGFFNQSGELVEYQEVGRDITELKRNQEALAFRKNELEASVAEKNQELSMANRKLVSLNGYLNDVLKNITEGVAVFDEFGQLGTINEFLKKKWGNLLPKLIEKFKKIICEEPQSVLAKMIIEKIPFNDQEMTLEKGNENLHCLVSGSPLEEEEDGIRKGVVIIRSITEVHRLVNRISGFQARFRFEDIITRSPAMLELIENSRKIAKNQMNVTIEGESGTGKELFAQSIHNGSDRSGESFIAVNCGALPSELLESELFGYTDGSFTGAKKGGKPGKFELASGGTLFLDEIGDMPLTHQVALLRVIQEKTITRIGGECEIPVDVRIICATNKDLLKQIELGNFREDLYYRLNVMHIKILPLRERVEDIQLLTQYFVDRMDKKKEGRILINDEVMAKFFQYSWPGNVRELQNIVEKSMYLSDGHGIRLKDLPEKMYGGNHMSEGTINESSIKKPCKTPIFETNPVHGTEEVVDQSIFEHMELGRYKESGNAMIESQERAHICSLLDVFDNNLSQVARKMKISRSTLYRKMKQYQIER